MNDPSGTADREVISTRLFPASRDRVWKAWADPKHLAQWWGPAGFTNTFREFDLRPDGMWRFTMHAPNGANYPNETKFVEVTPPERVIFRHLAPVHAFDMIMTFTTKSHGTEVAWRMIFDDAAECARVRKFVTEGNEQNFDRLQAHLPNVS
jgi:uncharacterized protein YndB with AHSA1/START domain